MKEVLVCFWQKMNMGAQVLSELFGRNKEDQRLPLAQRKGRIRKVFLLLILVAWGFFKRFLTVYLLVLLPVSLPRAMPEQHRIDHFICLLWCVQFLAGIGAPLGARHRSEPISLRTEIFWERIKDLIYMPPVFYLLTYSTGVTYGWCLVMAADLVCWRLVMESVFLFVTDRLYLTKRGEDALYYGSGLFFCIMGAILFFSGAGGTVGAWLCSMPSLLLTAVLGVLAAVYLLRFRKTS